MFDETDPVVRAIQAPFEANLGEFYRNIKDANAAYHEEADKIEEESAKLKEEQERILAGKAQQPEAESPAKRSAEFDYESPLASAQTEARRWPGTPPQTHAYERPDDEVDPAAERRNRLRQAAWAEPAAVEPEPAPWSAPPPPRVAPRSVKRRAEHDDEDYSSESWLQ